MSDNVVRFSSRQYVHFYKDYIDCDFCGQPTLGRVYENGQSIDCGACGRAMFEVKTEAAVIFTPDFENGESEESD